MFPIIFSIGPFTLHTLSLFAFVGTFLGLFVVWKRGREARFEEEILLAISLKLVVWMLLFGRIVQIITHWQLYDWSLLSWIDFLSKPGISFAGVILGFVLGSIYYARQYKYDKYSLADVLVIGLCLAQLMLALGFFMGGMSYGKPTNLPWGIQYLGMFDARHPVALYDSILLMILFLLLWWLEGVYRTFRWYRGNKSQAKTGFIVAIYFIIYGLISMFLNLLWDYSIPYGHWKYEYIFSILIVFLGILILYKRSGFTFDRKIDYASYLDRLSG